MQVGVVGGSGYGGGELLRLLEGHPTLEVAVVAGSRAAGSRVDDVLPHLSGTRAGALEIVHADAAMLADCAVVFLATPATTSMALAPRLVDAGAKVVDLSGAFRLDAAVYTRWYGDEHAAPDLAPAPYGLPEIFRAELAGAPLIAGPGCFATAAIIGLWPLTGLVDPATVSVTGLSGVSGAGRGLRDDLHAGHAMGNVAPYGAPSHRHTPEMEAAWVRAGAQQGRRIVPTVTFVPHLVPMTRGLVATAVATLAADATPEDVRWAFTDAYRDEPFVTVTPAWPSTAHVLGGNGAHVHAAVDDRSRRVVVSCAIDNLVKGAAGQALQAANVAAGIEEDAGLSPIGTYP